MKKLLAPLLLLPALAIAQSTTTDFFVNTQCTEDSTNIELSLYLRVSNLSDNMTNIRVDLYNKNNNNVIGLKGVENSELYSHFTSGVSLSIPANSTMHYQVQFVGQYSTRYPRYDYNRCSDAPIRGEITHLDRNSQIFAVGKISSKSYGNSELNINNGKIF